MDFNEVVDYLKTVKKIIEKKVPEEKLEKTMVRVANYIFSKWIERKDIHLTEKEIKKLIKLDLLKVRFLDKLEIKKLFNKYFKYN